MSYEFERYENEWAGGYQEKPKQPVRFSPKIKAAIEGKPLPDHTRDRVLEAQRDAAGQFLPKSTKPKMIKEAPAPAMEAGKAPEGIQSTKNYKQFKLLATNRPVDQRHVNKLAGEIRKKNLLNLNPIIVNSNHEVIEGQHRLKAAEKLGVSIFYIQNDQVTQNDIASLNSNKKNWAMMDYIHFFAEKGNRDFENFVELCKEYKYFQPGVLLNMCSGTGKKANYKEGVIDVSNKDSAIQTIEYIKDFVSHTPHATSTRFVEALSFIVRTGLYDHEHMMRKVLANPGMLQPCANTKDYIQLLERIYNKNVHEKNIVIFLKRR